MATPIVDQFLGEISRIIREENGLQLQDYLVVEPPYGDLYQTMIGEIRKTFSKGAEDVLEKKCEAAIPEARGGGETASWSAFVKFMVQYLGFLRDVDTQNLLETYNLLNELVQKCNSALAHATLGTICLPTVVAYSRMLSRLAIGLDRQPHLIAHLTQQSTDEGGARETLPERAANIMRQAFVTCLNDRSGDGSGLEEGKPAGKKTGVYKIANLCLKVLFQCRKIRNAEQMFVNIDNQAPPLSVYPRSERVTYLYYLGRFYFSSNHFYRAQLVLQRAYDESPKYSIKQRRLILTYLISSNIILGRFPSQSLLQRPEAADLADKFLPICDAIRRGDLAGFRQTLFLKESDARIRWLLYFRIYLQIRNRCEILVWRTMFRKTFLLRGTAPAANSRQAHTLALQDVLHIVQRIEIKTTSVTSNVDDDFAGADDEDDEDPDPLLPDMMEIESIASSLRVQGLLSGYLSHRLLKLAIPGAKEVGPLAKGFPNVWQTVIAKCNDQVPGWVKDRKTNGSVFGPGRVVNLSGARPAGSAP